MNQLNKDQVKNLKKSGKILNHSLTSVVAKIKPGMSAFTIDQLAELYLRRSGAKPSFLNYRSSNQRPFPNSLCLSINHEIVHGVPCKDKILKEGDIVSLDLGAEYQGMFTDMAVTLIVGAPKSKRDQKLIQTARDALYEGIRKAKVGNTTGDIGYAVQKHVEARGFNVIRSLVGHGIGVKPHLDPQIPNFGQRGEGVKLIPNIAIAIEPMIVAGHYDTSTSWDGWTVITQDGSLAAHYEHTVFISDHGTEIITE